MDLGWGRGTVGSKGSEGLGPGARGPPQRSATDLFPRLSDSPLGTSGVQTAISLEGRGTSASETHCGREQDGAVLPSRGPQP